MPLPARVLLGSLRSSVADCPLVVDSPPVLDPPVFRPPVFLPIVSPATICQFLENRLLAVNSTPFVIGVQIRIVVDRVVLERGTKEAPGSGCRPLPSVAPLGPFGTGMLTGL